jgi:hypothetical protein
MADTLARATELRVLSVRQPWASLIASGRKTIELRSWATKYRGPVLIVSGASAWRGDHAYEIGPRGVAVCVVDLVECRASSDSDEAAACLLPPPGFGFALCLANARPVAPVPVKGKLGLYRCDDALRVAVGS